MALRYYNSDKSTELLPGYKGTDEELTKAINDITLLYSSAIKTLETKLEILSDDFEKKHEYMPVHHVTSRLKSFRSTMEKAVRYEIEDPINNLDIVQRDVYDIAGVRVICNYEEDLYVMSDLLLDQSDIELIRIKDYCKKPKPSGYRSLHIVVAIPVYLVNSRALVPVEIQFRSIAMDTWASLEHELRYKHKGVLTEDTKQQLKECAKSLAQVDEKMAKIRREVLKEENEYSNY